MFHEKYENFTECYRDLTSAIMFDYEHDSAPRGMKIRESLGVSFQINNPRDRLLYVPSRKFSLPYYVAESVWYMLGDNKTDWISNYSSFWKNISDDGVTANSAYGARLFKQNPIIAGGMINQYDYIVDELRRDPDSRRAVMHIRVPDDSLYAKKDVPCTLSLQFFVRNNKLDMLVSMRSSDLVFGISYDVPFFTLMQEMLALRLGVELGKYMHVSGSLHIYERHFDMCQNIIDEPDMGVSLPMPAATSEMPAAWLDSVQRTARGCDLTGASPLLEQLAHSCVQSGNESYWIDFALVLIMHRADKLKLHDLSKKLVNMIAFEGFRLIAAGDQK